MRTRHTPLAALFALTAVIGSPREAAAQNIESPVRVIEGLEPVELEYGDHTVGAAIDVIGDSDLYEFFGEIGDVVKLTIHALGSVQMEIHAVDPDGDRVLTNYTTSSGDSYRSQITLQKRGRFQVRLYERGENAAGGYILQLERMPPLLNERDLNLLRLYPGSARFEDSVFPASDTDFFVFDAEEGTRVSLHLRVLDSWQGHVEIWSEDGVRLVVNYSTSSGADFSTQADIPTTGSYYASISENGENATGRYDISLQCISGSCPDITEAVYQLVDAGPNCISVRLINNVPVVGGAFTIGYPSSVVSLAAENVTAGPDLPEEIDIDVVTDIPLDGCTPAPEDPDIDRGLTINWLDRDGGDVILLPGRHEILTLCFDPADGTDNETCPAIEFLDCLGPAEGPVENIVTHPLGGTVVAETVDARLCLTVDTPFRRGDANGDGRYDVSDPIAILLCQFLGRGCTTCPVASDANDDGAVDQSDAIYLLNWRFHMGPAPAAPFPRCGVDPPDPSPALCIEPACI